MGWSSRSIITLRGNSVAGWGFGPPHYAPAWTQQTSQGPEKPNSCGGVLNFNNKNSTTKSPLWKAGMLLCWGCQGRWRQGLQACKERVQEFKNSEEPRKKIYEEAFIKFSTGYNQGLKVACDAPSVPLADLQTPEFNSNGEEVHYGKDKNPFRRILLSCPLLSQQLSPPNLLEMTP